MRGSRWQEPEYEGESGSIGLAENKVRSVLVRCFSLGVTVELVFGGWLRGHELPVEIHDTEIKIAPSYRSHSNRPKGLSDLLFYIGSSRSRGRTDGRTVDW